MKRALKKISTTSSKETAAGFLQIIFVLLVVGSMLAITSALNFNADQGPTLSNTPEKLVVDVLIPHTQSYAPSQTFSGVVEARANVTLSPEVNGRVEMVHPNLLPGGIIGANEVLFSLDKTDYQIALERAYAEVAAASADLAQNQANADNFIKDWQKVYPNEPAPTLVAKEPQIAAIEARLKAAKANVRLARTNLERTEITTKNAIRIVESNIEEGLFVVAGGQYGSYYVPQSLRIRAATEPSVIDKLSLVSGKVVQITTPGVNFKATVTSTGAALDSQTRLQPIMITLPENSTLPPGTFVTVTATGETISNVFRLPATALATRNSVRRVNEGRLEGVDIELIDLTDDHVVTKAFDIKDGIVVSQVPTSFAKRPVSIRKVLQDETSGS